MAESGEVGPAEERVQTPDSAPNLVECPDCLEEVSRRARECPHCGAPMQVQSDTGHTTQDDNSGKATGGLIAGICAVFAALLPIIGLPLSITGIVLSWMGKESAKRTRALWGLGLSIVAFLLALINAIIGAYLGATGQLF